MVSVGWLKFRKLRRGERDPTTNAGLGFRGQRQLPVVYLFGKTTTTSQGGGGRGTIEPEGGEITYQREEWIEEREQKQKAEKCCGGGRLCSFRRGFVVDPFAGSRRVP